MNLFLEKVKQNRKLLKNKGNLHLLLVNEAELLEALSAIEEYSNSIIVFKGDCSNQLKKLFRTISCHIMVNEDFKTGLEKILHDQTYLSSSPTIPLESPHTILLEITPNVEPFLVNDKLINTLNNSGKFNPYSFYLSKECIYPVLIPIQSQFRFIQKDHSIKKKAVLLDWFFGNGDIVIIYQQLRAFIDKEKVNYEIHIITREKPKLLIKDLFPDCKVYTHFDSFYVYEFITRSSFYDDVYFINTRLSHPPHLHLVDIAAMSLGLEEPVSPFVEEVHVPPLPKEVRSKLNQLKRKFNVVGVQFKTNDSERSWDIENINQFIDYCKNNNIKLINLTPNNKLPTGIIEYSDLPLSQLFELMSYLDAFVGIDSVCGHIAGVVGTPSITIWGKDTPISGSKNPFVSYRVLSQNYSIFPESRNIKDVSAKIVFKRLENVLQVGFQSAERITIEQTKSGYNTEELRL